MQKNNRSYATSFSELLNILGAETREYYKHLSEDSRVTFFLLVIGVLISVVSIFIAVLFYRYNLVYTIFISIATELLGGVIIFVLIDYQIRDREKREETRREKEHEARDTLHRLRQENLLTELKAELIELRKSLQEHH